MKGNILTDRSNEGNESNIQPAASPRDSYAVGLADAAPAPAASSESSDVAGENGRQATKARRRERRRSKEPDAQETGDVADTASNGVHAEPVAEHRERVQRERGPRRGKTRRPQGHEGTSEPGTDPATAEPAVGEAGLAGTEPASDEPDDVAPPLLAVDGKSGTRVATRTRKKQQAAEAAIENAEDSPSLGALNRHLNSMMQQLTAAHRVIGRVAAERDALRQQLADLQGIPVDQIAVTTIGAAPEAAPRSTEPATAEQKPPSRLARLNYFGGDDYATMRKRRQGLAIALLLVVVALGFSSRIGIWALPSNLSRESLGQLPYIGDFMTIFLAGWLFFRVIRVSSKGVKWIFPSEDQRRRRR